MKKTFFADVLLPLPLPGYYTYRVPADLNGQVQAGKRVAVQFGKKKIYSGLVRRVHQRVPDTVTPKYILSVIDEKSILAEKQFAFWEWMAEYYMTTPGEVMNAALPSGLKLTSESSIVLNPDFDSDITDLSEKELLITESLMNKTKLPVSEAIEITDQQKILPLIKNLIEKGVVLLEEELQDRYKPRKEVYVSMPGEISGDEQKLRDIFDALGKKAFKQLQLLISFINLTRNGEKELKEIKRTDLLKSVDAGYASLQSLEKKGILETHEKTVSRFEEVSAPASASDIELSEHQREAFEDIKKGFEEKDVVLLHGITSSGKTEIYIKLIEEQLRQNKQVLYLLPEIALTSQIINRLRKYFGDLVGVYHSRYNEGERAETWNNVLNFGNSDAVKNTPLILGARSAIFLPFKDPGLIIVDEEHDTSYKQTEPSPRYLARDSGVFLGSMFNVPVLLGSATPSLETYSNVKNGKYGYAKLTERYRGMETPEIIVADLRKERQQKTMRSHFSAVLVGAMKDALEKKEQVILFQNRRGFSTRLECEDCRWIPYCIHCDISLTYHKYFKEMKCHYCGYSTGLPDKCPDCGSTRLSTRGFGTEKVEEELALIFPEARIRRMDLDSTKSRYAHQSIITDFEDHKIDVLVGTQMVTKGLDFDRVSLVGILNADNMINFPDFRAQERSFQLMEQVSGRAGRKFKRGKVIIQSYKPEHQVIEWVKNHDFEMMARIEMHQRSDFKYPPYYRLIMLRLKHKDSKEVRRAASDLAYDLRQKLGRRVLGPEFPLVTRVRGLYIQHILVKLDKKTGISSTKVEINNIIKNFVAVNTNRRVRVIVDVDPV